MKRRRSGRSGRTAGTALPAHRSAVIFITPRDAEFGFSLAGVDQRTVEIGDAEAALAEAVAESDRRLIVLDERLLTAAGEELIREIEERWQGVLLILPSPERPVAEVEDYAERLIRRAIGYHVRLNV